jgi:hypothetical protein
MAQYKGTIFFTAGTNGWTERYFMNGSSLGTASAALLSVIADRLPILHTACEIVAATISDIAIRGDSVPLIGVSEAGTAVDTTGYLDVDNAVLVKWTVGVFSRNKTFLRGIPNAQQSSGVYDPASPFTTNFAAWAGSVLANCFFAIPGALNPTPPPKYIYSYGPASDYTVNHRIARRKSGRPFGLPRGRRIAP